MGPLDQDLQETMSSMVEIMREMGWDQDTDDQLRMRIVGHNLRGMAEMFMVAHEKEIQLNCQQLALGMLGTADWLMETLPVMED